MIVKGDEHEMAEKISKYLTDKGFTDDENSRAADEARRLSEYLQTDTARELVQLFELERADPAQMAAALRFGYVLAGIRTMMEVRRGN